MKEHLWKYIPPVANVEQKLTAGMRSAARPLRVLEFFDEVRRPARAREIWERLDLPQSTTSLLLKGMVTLGYLDYDPLNRSYQPSLRVTLLGSWRDSGRLRTGALTTMLETLSERTGLAASLTSRNGIYLRYMQIMQFERPGRAHMTLGSRRYAVWSTAGMVLLATLTDREIALLVRRTLAEKDIRARSIEPDRVRKMIEAARLQNYFAETGLVTLNVRSISKCIPVDVSGCGVPLALTLANGLPELGFHDEELSATMDEVVATLSG
ncbi:MAG TPA: helix-turn-helix domain-containing protein [Pseudolabrys sp.]|nr:helix-turn-helix domain-containing protein [Pseudolabrys sp.]